MAPLVDEPDAIRVVLNMARRKAFYSLVSEIMAYMRSQLDLRPPEERPGAEGSNSPHLAASAKRDGATSPPGSRHGQTREDSARRSTPPPPPSPALVRLRRAAVRHFDAWRTETLRSLKDVVAKADDARVVEARQKRAEARARTEAAAKEDLLVFESAPAASTSASSPLPEGGGNGSLSDREKTELDAFRNLYHPIPTRLTTIPLRDREEALGATMLLVLSAGRYSAYARTLLCYLASALGIPPSRLNAEETAIATTLAQTVQKASAEGQAGGAMSAESEAQKRRDENRAGRLWKVGLASVAGAAIVGVTGGLAAPVVAAAVGGIMGSVGLGGLAGFLGLFWMNGALVGALFGAFGAKMTGEMADRYAREVDDFKFLPLKSEFGDSARPPAGREGDAGADVGARRLRVTIGVNGWLETEDDVTKPWRALADDTEVFALRYEMASLLALGAQLRALVGSAAWGLVRAELLKRTVLATVKGALWPVFLLSSASRLDNPFSLARNRSDKAGEVLADALANRVQGERAVTLVGYSLGARVVYSCLRTLAGRGAFGVVDTVVLIGAPVPSSAEHWGMMRAVVAGKLFNVHSENDYILGFLYRGTSLQLGIAGLQAVGEDIEGVEDLDLSEEVLGHLRYPGLIPQILHRCGFVGVKWGDEAIEKDARDGGITLRDSDYPEVGILVDLGDDEDDEERPSLPPRRAALDGVDERSGPAVDLKGHVPMNLRPVTSDTAAVNPRITNNPTPPPSTSDSSEKRRGDIKGTEGHSFNTSHQGIGAGPGLPTRFQLNRPSGDDNINAEDYITTVEDDDLSEDELTMLEPLSIDEEDLAKEQRHR